MDESIYPSKNSCLERLGIITEVTRIDFISISLLERNNSGEVRVTEDFLDNKAPQYATLSHTWGPGEVDFGALMDGTSKSKLGYEKIRFCGDQAQPGGLQFFWVDTCCINKSNNTELQKAINSMFR